MRPEVLRFGAALIPCLEHWGVEPLPVANR